MKYESKLKRNTIKFRKSTYYTVLFNPEACEGVETIHKEGKMEL
jgi:hypothetical protein